MDGDSPRGARTLRVGAMWFALGLALILVGTVWWIAIVPGFIVLGGLILWTLRWAVKGPSKPRERRRGEGSMTALVHGFPPTSRTTDDDASEDASRPAEH